LHCWFNDVIAIISNRVRKQTDKRNDQSLNLPQCSQRSLGGDNKQQSAKKAMQFSA